MGQVVHQPIESVIVRTFNEIARSANDTRADDQTWLDQMSLIIHDCGVAEMGFLGAQALALALVEREWDDLEFDVRATYDLSFKVYAMQKTNRAWSTIDNYIRTARLWFLENTRPLGPVDVPLRLPNGKLQKENGEPLYTPVEFDARKVDLTKLMVCNATARAGRMTPRLWSLLADPMVRCEDLTEELREPREGTQEALRFLLVGPTLLAQRGLDEVIIVDDNGFNWEDYYQNEDLTRDAIDRIMKVLGIKMDDELIVEGIRKQRLTDERFGFED